MEIPAFVRGRWIIWKTKLDDLGTRSLQVGASAYARCILDGMSEVKSHQMAEKAVFEEYYRVKY